MLPANFLRQLIRLYGDTLQGVVPGYLEASMETFARNQEKMREQMRATFGTNPALVTFETMTRANMEWFQNAMRMFSPYAAAQRSSGGAASADPQGAPDKTVTEGKPRSSTDDDLDALKRKLIDMQSQLDKLSKSD